MKKLLAIYFIVLIIITIPVIMISLPFIYLNSFFIEHINKISLKITDGKKELDI